MFVIDNVENIAKKKELFYHPQSICVLICFFPVYYCGHFFKHLMTY